MGRLCVGEAAALPQPLKTCKLRSNTDEELAARNEEGSLSRCFPGKRVKRKSSRSHNSGSELQRKAASLKFSG